MGKIRGRVLFNQVYWGYFVFGIIAIIITCLFSKVGEVENQSISVLEILLMDYEEIRLRTTWLSAFGSALYGWLFLLLPVITGIANIPLFCDEISSQNYRLRNIRIGFNQYVNQHFISSYLSSFGVWWLQIVETDCMSLDFIQCLSFCL